MRPDGGGVLTLNIAGRAGHSGVGKIRMESLAETCHFLGAHQLLHGLEQFAFLAADMRSEPRREVAQGSRGQARSEGGAKANVVAPQVIYKGSKLCKTFRSGKKHALLGVEVKADFLVEETGSFLLQFGDLVIPRAGDANAQRKRVLVLVRKRHEGGVA
jgi:hypothetical protein